MKALLPLAAAMALFPTAHQVLAAPQEAGDLEIEEKFFETADGAVHDYELGTLYVPENREDPDSRVIGIGFARFRCDGDAEAPPMFRLPGGPGGSYLMRMKAGGRNLEYLMADVERFRSFCDVVFVDQRGFSDHGDILRASFRIPKRDPSRVVTEADRQAAMTAFAHSAVEAYEDTDVDLRGYTVIECAHDVADLAKGLDYPQVMLNGTSFGSQWSFAVMRLHPKLVARAVLSGVEPLDHGYDMPSYVFAAIQRMWRVIDADERFAPYLPEGGMAEAARTVIERLEREPARIESTGRSSGKTKLVGMFGPDDFPYDEPAHILELYHGRTDRWKQKAVSERGDRQLPAPLLGFLIDTSLGATPERAHRMMTDPATRYTSRGNFADRLATAHLWPSPDVGDDFRTPVLCEVPVVFAHGDWDLKTPIENMYEIAPFFSNSRCVVAHRGGHGVLEPIAQQLPHAWQELEEFCRTGDLDGIPERVTLAPSRSFDPPTFELPK